MSKRNLKEVIKDEQKQRAEWLRINPKLNDESGIYILYREDRGIKFAYIGQARHILHRLVQHLNGYQHIDLSLKKHGLVSEQNPSGWRVTFLNCPEANLDAEEQKWISYMANKGYQLRNKTVGGQGEGKYGLDNQRANKGYRDGLKQGELNARRFVAKLFEKNLEVKIQGAPNKNKEKALEKFYEFIKTESEN